MIDLKENIRLIIWDLDETFWNGTLTEGGISFVEDNEKLIIELAKRGIMSSICSKNNKNEVDAILKERNLIDYFIFNSINWNPKASRVKDIIDAIGLRPECVLFIDDNMQNLNQAKSLMPNLNISLPDIIRNIKDSPYFQGKDDSSLSRLKQYKINEEKSQIKNEYVSNIDFLKESNIVIEFEYDIINNIDRAIELINRTNQLNFTKKRLPENINEAKIELTEKINKNTNFSALVKVKDDFGDYGFVGYVSINRINKEYICEHFCFSCRTLNMFIESWVYEELGRPKIKISEPVSGNLICNEDLSWINNSKIINKNKSKSKKIGKIFLRGGCDVASLVHYLNPHGEVTSEFNTVINSLPQRIDHSNVFLNSIDNKNLDIATSLGLQPKELITSFSPNYDLYIFSFWADVDLPVYSRHINEGYLPFWLTGSLNKDLTKERELLESLSNEIDENVIGYFKSDIKFSKFLEDEEMKSNYEKILSYIPDNKKVILIGANSKGIQYFNGNKVLNKNHERYNKILIELSEKYSNVYYIDVNELIKYRNDILDLNHFSRMTYHTIYNEILEKI